MERIKFLLVTGMAALLAGLALLLLVGLPPAGAAPLGAPTPIAVQSISRLGITPVFTNASALGNSWPNDGRTVLYVKNGGSSTITVTVDTPLMINGLAVADLAFTVPNAGEKVAGPFEPETFNQPLGSATAGQISVAYSGVSNVTVGAFRLNP